MNANVSLPDFLFFTLHAKKHSRRDIRLKNILLVNLALVFTCSVLYAQYDPYPDKSIFAEKRQEFMTKIGDEAVAVIVAHDEYTRNDDVDHDYRQDSDMFYLTGFEEPRSIAVIRPGDEKHKFILFVRKRDKLRETWDGRRFGTKGAMEIFGADTAYVIDDFEKMLRELVRGAKTIYHNFGADKELSETITGRFAASGGRADVELKNVRFLLGEMRKI
ncbi:MAG: aminopeptidase P N-terminal domain-containing protein, partial [Candidatus Marinimicrobia bacterium]|nr:aminopeptidase P N-terminal domain-containing protein [Candidatus Neomarinimicrobiota bacterium]